MAGYVQRTNQLIIRLLARFVMFFLADIKVYGRENLSGIKKPVLVISNHKSYYDPLIISVGLPVFSKLYPLSFIGKDQLFSSFFRSLFFSSIGAFPAFRGQGLDKSLQIPSSIIESRGTVVFFPEGKCYRERNLGPAKPGAATLALRHSGLTVLPIAIANSYLVSEPKIFNKPQVSIIFGKPFRMEGLDRNGSVEELRKMMMREIEKNYEKIN